MGSNNPPPRSTEPSLEQKIRMTDSFGSFLHNGSLVMLVLAPVLIAIPPRKLDLYTLSLIGGFTASTNYLVKERTGAGLLYQLPGARLPQSAIEYQERMKLREHGARLLEVGRSQEQSVRPSMQETLEKHKTTPQHQERGLEKTAKDLWMGSEKDDWKSKRLAEEQKKLDEGEGYGGMIMDQIWEVWTWGEKKAEEVKEKDEKVVETGQREKKREEEFPTIGKRTGVGVQHR